MRTWTSFFRPFLGPLITSPPILQGNITAMSSWDDRWLSIIDDPLALRSARCRLPFSPCLQLIAEFDSWGRVLVVGCGVSTEPEAIAEAGCTVFAFDSSEVAIAYVVQHPATREELAYWQQMTPRAPGLAKHPGTCTHSVDELLRFSPTGQYDVVYFPWIFNLLSEEERSQAASRAFEWTAAGGSCLVALQNALSCEVARVGDVFARNGYFELNRKSRKFNALGGDWTKYEQIRVEEQRAARARLTAGHKMLVIFNAGG
jgi:SAM-dependent methyltransferase